MANLSNINGKFVVEQTTGYVGVGTTDPSYPIEVLNASAEIALNASGGSIYRLRSDSTDSFRINKNGVGDRLVIDGSGNSTFSGSITAAGGTMTADTTFNSNIILEGNIFHKDDTNTYFGFNPGTSTDDTIVFATTNVKRLVINPGGVVTVGTAKRYVDSSNTQFDFEVTEGMAFGGSAFTFATIQGDSAGNGNIEICANAYPANTGAEAKITFKTATSGGGQNDKALVIKGPNVGIGTDSPRYQLDLAKANSSQADYIALGVNNGNTAGTGTALGSGLIWKANYTGYTKRSAGIVQIAQGSYFRSALAFYTNGTADAGTDWSERMRIDMDGNVGIGTSSPSRKLVVAQSNVTEPSGIDANTSILIKNNTWSGIQMLATEATGNFITFGDNVNGFAGRIQYSHATNAMQFETAAVERMRIDSSGNMTLLNATATNSRTIGITNSSGTTGWTLGNGVLSNTHQFVIYDNTAGAARMLVNSAGNVQILGIGNKNKGNLQLGPSTTGSKWSVLTGSHYNATSGSGNGSGSAGVMMIGVNAENGENHLVIGGAIYEANAATDIQFWTHTTDTSTAGGTEKMRITSVGNIHISGGSYTTGSRAKMFENNPNTVDLKSSSSGAGLEYHQEFANPNSTVGSITSNGSTTAYNTTSDYRLKEDLQDFAGLEMVSKIPVYEFKWKTDESRSYGVMAHELQEVLPDAVAGEKDAEVMQGVDYAKIVPLLIKSIQELKAEIEILKNK